MWKPVIVFSCLAIMVDGQDFWRRWSCRTADASLWQSGGECWRRLQHQMLDCGACVLRGQMWISLSLGCMCSAARSRNLTLGDQVHARFGQNMAQLGRISAAESRLESATIGLDVQVEPQGIRCCRRTRHVPLSASVSTTLQYPHQICRKPRGVKH